MLSSGGLMTRVDLVGLEQGYPWLLILLGKISALRILGRLDGHGRTANRRVLSIEVSESLKFMPGGAEAFQFEV